MQNDIYNKRPLIILGIFIAFGIAILAKLFSIQVLDDTYKNAAASTVLREEISYPARGLIYDRKGKIIVKNEPIYDIMVVPRDVSKTMDTLQFCNLLGIEKTDFKARLQKARKFSNYKSSSFYNQITAQEFAQIQEFLYKFPGFFPTVRNIRSYPYGNAPHIVGYLSEVNAKDLKKDTYYSGGDFIGSNGLEYYYEEWLRGEKGKRVITVDVMNREQGSFKNGAEDKVAKAGSSLQLTLDIELQAYTESLMRNKRGSCIAIDPQNGEILAMVSNPAYDPNLLSGRNRSKNYQVLADDTLKPLMNRPMQASYPPGSIMKPLIALIALQEKATTPWWYFACPGYYNVTAKMRKKCSHRHAACKNIEDAIKESCNPYFWSIFRETIENEKYPTQADALMQFTNYLEKAGFGVPLNIDLPYEKLGSIPTRELYNKMYGEGRWGATTIISLGIGQGEFSVTPLQMAHMTSIIAARGRFRTPHLVRTIDNSIIPPNIDTAYKQYPVDSEYFEHIIEGMFDVVEDGTGKNAQIAGIEVCGKTGTAQNPHGEDHSVFIAFAPKDNPKIAVATIVENGGYGSRYGAPISSLTIEKYLNDTISTKNLYWEKRMLEADLINTAKEAAVLD